MASTKYIKVILLGAFTLFLAVWLGSGMYSNLFGIGDKTAEALVVLPDDKDKTGYVGSETCQSCHEDQFKDFEKTKHAKLSNLESWKDKVQGCESCHGPGKDHVEGGGDKTKIVSFKNKNPKEISETCLTCHAGKESHNNYRRGDHWRNNVGCTDCHTAHGSNHGEFKVGSTTLVNDASNLNPAPAMLKTNEQQLCISCHSEVKSHFNKPFRHKVMEGTMKCSDCHNAHGGFESKQTKLGIGADTACVRCHTDKQGPFVFEHAPLKVEGCSACHTPHGSANPRLLKRNQVRQLCLECHSGITEQLSDGPTGGPHDQKTLLQRNCTACHTMIHGSNSSNVFFR
jgi:DmsE family decaheme c-type cytochrome